MKNKWTMMAGVVATLIGFSATLQATPINGTINFTGGTMTFNSTTITSFGGSTVVSSAAGTLPTGTYSGTEGTGSTSATFASGGFVYSPGLSGLVNPLWTFVYGGNTYSFNLSAVTYSSYIGGSTPALTVQGIGTLYIKDGSNNNVYDPTLGNFTLTATGSGTTTFGFNAGNNTNVPDGGATVILLGAALSAMGLLRRKLIA